MASAFDCYAGAVGTIKEQRERVARTMARWKSPGLKRAMEAWTEYVDIMLEERAQEAQELAREHMQDMVKKQEEKAESEAARRIEVCKRVVGRMLRQQLATAWSTFVECVCERKSNRETVRKVLSRMTHRAMAGAFDCFCGSVQALLAQRERAQRQRRICSRIVRRMLKQQLSIAWLRFVDCVRTIQRTRTVLHRVIGCFKMQCACAALCQWSEIAAKCRRIRAVVGRAISRWRLAVLVKAWASWHQLLVRQRRLRAVARKICLRMMHRSVHAMRVPPPLSLFLCVGLLFPSLSATASLAHTLSSPPLLPHSRPCDAGRWRGAQIFGNVERLRTRLLTRLGGRMRHDTNISKTR